jgi:type IV pilus assembly protein PilO
VIFFENRHWQTIIGVLGAFLVGAILCYFLLLRPTDERIELLTSQKQNINVTEPVESEPVEIPENQLIELSVKVPIARKEESIVLDLEQAALASDTVLESILFNYDGVPTNLEDEEIGIKEKDEEEPVEETYSSSSPDGLQSILVELSIQSKDYESMLLFIKEMESVDRIYKIESFEFTGFNEGDERQGPMEDMLTYSVQLVTYYAPDIALTFNQVSAPSSDEANKNNPIQDVKESEEKSVDEKTDAISEDEPKTEDVDQQTTIPVPPQPTIKTHVVKNGETLFSISMDYFGNRNGESIIMRANSKKSNTVYVGEVLRIP